MSMFPEIGDIVGPGNGLGNALEADTVKSIDANTFMEVFTITAAMEAAKQVELSTAPTTVEDVVCAFFSGSTQIYGEDFIIENGTELKWDTLGMDTDGIAVEGEKFYVQYVV